MNQRDIGRLQHRKFTGLIERLGMSLGKVKTGDLPKKLVGGRKLGTTGEVKGVELGDLGLWARDECSVNQL